MFLSITCLFCRSLILVHGKRDVFRHKDRLVVSTACFYVPDGPCSSPLRLPIKPTKNKKINGKDYSATVTTPRPVFCPRKNKKTTSPPAAVIQTPKSPKSPPTTINTTTSLSLPLSLPLSATTFPPLLLVGLQMGLALAS